MNKEQFERQREIDALRERLTKLEAILRDSSTKLAQGLQAEYDRRDCATTLARLEKATYKEAMANKQRRK